MLVYVQANQGKNTGEIKKAIGLQQRTTERWLKQLKDEGKIEFRGASKTGGYFAREE